MIDLTFHTAVLLICFHFESSQHGSKEMTMKHILLHIETNKQANKQSFFCFMTNQNEDEDYLENFIKI